MEEKAIQPDKPSVQSQRERTRKQPKGEGSDITAGLDKQQSGSNEATVFSKPRPDSPGYGGSDTSPPGTGYATP